MAPAPADTSQQPTLRVMRLYKPRLDGRRVLPSCPAAAGTAAAGATVPAGRGEGDFALSSSLKLPDSFGNIYLGETFTAYIRYDFPTPVALFAEHISACSGSSPQLVGRHRNFRHRNLY